MAVPYAEVIGDPIAHSKSPLIHDFWLRQLQIKGEYRAHRLSLDELPAYLAGRRADPHWRGCNVTMPHKTVALEMADECDPDAEAAGAANVLVPTAGGRLLGVNTDVKGFRETMPVGGGGYRDYVTTLVNLVGTGGAARAVTVALRDFYSEVTVFSRQKARADAFANAYGLGADYGFSGNVADLAEPRIRYDPAYPDTKPNYGIFQRYSELIINASPMGMRGHPDLDVALEGWPSDTVVYDCVYDPIETGLVRRAKQHGLRVLDGLWLLIAQAAASFGYFYGAQAPREYDLELRELLLR